MKNHCIIQVAPEDYILYLKLFGWFNDAISSGKLDINAKYANMLIIHNALSDVVIKCYNTFTIRKKEARWLSNEFKSFLPDDINNVTIIEVSQIMDKLKDVT